MWTDSVPWARPARPMLSPRPTTSPVATSIWLRYETETLRPDTGSMVTVFIPATDPANVTFPDAGAKMGSP
ncbi:hypothetical protein BH23ACT4_BH23ACT4_07920 [soil metagenome]